MEDSGEAHKTLGIHWGNLDIEDANGVPRGHDATLRHTTSNVSMNSLHSGRGSIDPSIALPIAYRSVFFQINEQPTSKDATELQKAEQSAAEGMPIT